MKELQKHIIPQFIKGGNAIITVKNVNTGNRFTFKIRKKENTPYFVSVLTGTDNNSCYTYIGILNPKGEFILTKGSKHSAEAQSVQVAKWYFPRAIHQVLPEFISTHHEGRCGCCGKKLTVPESIELGFGPYCAGQLGYKLNSLKVA